MNQEIKKLKSICKGIQTTPTKSQMSKMSDVLKTIKNKYNEHYVIIIQKKN
tara:strand:- start:428 stop:580 length:153 start_codon:yes stop_codon:yes gene_type:complete